MEWTGILQVESTRIQIWEKGKAPSRDIAHSVREQVVPGEDFSIQFPWRGDSFPSDSPTATNAPNMQKVNRASKIVDAAYDLVPW